MDDNHVFVICSGSGIRSGDPLAALQDELKERPTLESRDLRWL